MTDDRADEIVCRALEVDESQRSQFVDEKCDGDTTLKKRVVELLDGIAQVESEGFLPGPAIRNSVAATEHASVLNSLGKNIDDIPRVVLREVGTAPLVRPNSADAPVTSPDARYQLHGEIARGGMGAIIRGRDADLGRDLVIKVLLDSHRDKPEHVRRFVEEAQIGGQLQHPGIVPVYELGQFEDSRPFFSMKLVKGSTLSALLKDRNNEGDDSRFLGIFEQVCQTMAYAHSRDVIHRDLKPANIMIGAFGEVQVMDWGLAKVLIEGGIDDEKRSLEKHNDISVIRTLRNEDSDASVGSGSDTVLGSVMGTFAYMPPEQAIGQVDRLDKRADVFALGAILTEILTGKPPYVDKDPEIVHGMAGRAKLEDCFARLDACGAEEELLQIAKACLEPEPEDRLADAGVLADRITHHQTRHSTTVKTGRVGACCL